MNCPNKWMANFKANGHFWNWPFVDLGFSFEWMAMAIFHNHGTMNKTQRSVPSPRVRDNSIFNLGLLLNKDKGQFQNRVNSFSFSTKNIRLSNQIRFYNFRLRFWQVIKLMHCLLLIYRQFKRQFWTLSL